MAGRAHLLPRLGIAMLALLPAPLLAAPSPEQAALANRLLAAMPVSDTEAAMTQSAIAERADIEVAHPGKAAEIAPIYADFATCLHEGVDRGAKDAIRHVALDMPPADLTTLVDFFAGPDYVRFLAVSQREEKGETLSADDRKILAIAETPTMTKFYKAMLQHILEKAMNGKPPEDADCAGPKAARLAAIGITAPLPPPEVSMKDDQ